MEADTERSPLSLNEARERNTDPSIAKPNVTFPRMRFVLGLASYSSTLNINLQG